MKFQFFEGDVLVTTDDQSEIKSKKRYAKLDKNKNILILEKNILLKDRNGNFFRSRLC